jgi:putative FmdB family regulatory protein
MPIYEYRCERGHNFEVLQRMTEDPLTVCEEHGTPVHRVFHPVAVHFKGSGFYNTDYGKKKKSASSDGKSEADSGSTTTTGGDYKKKDAGPGAKDSGSGSKDSGSGSKPSGSSSD